MKKWFVTTIATAAIAASIPAAAFAEEAPQAQEPKSVGEYYAEDSLNHWASTDLSDFIQGDILSGYQEDGAVSIKPEGTVTRAEFVAIVLRAANVAPVTGDAQFTDVKGDDWFYGDVVTASEKGLIYGRDAEHFAPNQPITRAEISSILNRFFKDSVDFTGEAKTFADVAGHWAQPDIEQISQAGIVVGYGDGFKPDNNATRAEASSMIRRALHKETKASPSSEELATVTEEFNNALNELIPALKFDEAEALLNDKTIGFYNAMEQYSLGVLKESLAQATEAGATVELKVTGDAKIEVKFASDRYAAVSVTGQSIEMTATMGDKTETQSTSTDETYLLRKVDGAWKIYGGEKLYNSFVELMKAPTEPVTPPSTEPSTEPSTGTEQGTGTETGKVIDPVTEDGTGAVTDPANGDSTGAVTDPTEEDGTAVEAGDGTAADTGTATDAGTDAGTALNAGTADETGAANNG